MKKIFTSDSYWNVYSTACVITVQAFTFFTGVHASELYKTQNPH